MKILTPFIFIVASSICGADPKDRESDLRVLLRGSSPDEDPAAVFPRYISSVIFDAVSRADARPETQTNAGDVGGSQEPVLDASAEGNAVAAAEDAAITSVQKDDEEVVSITSTELAVEAETLPVAAGDGTPSVKKSLALLVDSVEETRSNSTELYVASGSYEDNSSYEATELSTEDSEEVVVVSQKTDLPLGKTVYQKSIEWMEDAYTLSILLPIGAGLLFATTIIVTIAFCRCCRRCCRRRKYRRHVLPETMKNMKSADRARLLAESSDEEF